MTSGHLKACHDEGLGNYWTPLRDPRFIQRMIERQEAEERDKRAWISGIKKRLRLVTIDDNPAGPGWHALPGGSAFRMTNDTPAPEMPEWPVLLEGIMSFTEWRDSLPRYR